jgi:GNAT superfamily N-acetyltransferase
MQSPSFTLRTPQPKDCDWVIERHGAIYAEEFGWNENFKKLVTEIALKFFQEHDPGCERGWIAEMNGKRIGCVFLVKESEYVAKLRLMLVEPDSRGLGLGALFIQECIDFAKNAGYAKVTLWTNNVLHAARHLYQAAGFQLIHSEANNEFGPELIAETWERIL